MNLFRIAALAVALLTAAPAFAQYQVPDHAVPIGRGGTNQGFKNAAPGTTDRPFVSNGPTSDPSFRQLPNAGLVPGAANTVKGSVDGTTTSDLAIASCSLSYQFTQWLTGTGWRCGLSPVLPTRAVAATLDLSAFTSITTQGYATPGDGGAGEFVKTAATNFLDSFIATGTLSANGTSGCTNGTLLGQVPNGPNTQAFQASFTITVAGNVVTSIVNVAPGNGYAAGTVLNFTVPGCTGAVAWTINTMTTPSGSFTDVAANKWQLIIPARGLDARSMGVKFDWSAAVGDAGSTDNFTTLQNAINFAAYSPGFIDTGAVNGGRVLLTNGTAKFCGSNGAVPLRVWNGVTLQGQGSTASVIKTCDAWVNTTNFVELCDSVSHVSCFGASMRSMQIFTTFTVGVGSAAAAAQAAVYTNACQQSGCGLYDMIIYPGSCRIGIKSEIGYGGASLQFLVNEVEIKGGQKAANCAAVSPPAVSLTGFGNTQIVMTGLTLSGLSPALGPRDVGVSITSGHLRATSFYAENVVSPLISNIVFATLPGSVAIDGFDGGPNCTNGVTRQAGSTAGTVRLGGAFANSCTNTYNNAGAGSGAVLQLTDVTF